MRVLRQDGTERWILVNAVPIYDDKAAIMAGFLSFIDISERVGKELAKNGGKPIMWKAGHSLIKGKMKEEKALLAGEMSGHLFFADRYFGYDDAIYAAMRLLRVEELATVEGLARSLEALGEIDRARRVRAGTHSS